MTLSVNYTCLHLTITQKQCTLLKQTREKKYHEIDEAHGTNAHTSNA